MGLKEDYFSTRSVSQLISLYGLANSYANTWITSTILYVDTKKGFLRRRPWALRTPKQAPQMSREVTQSQREVLHSTNAVIPPFHNALIEEPPPTSIHHASYPSKAMLPGGCHQKNSLLQEVQTLNQSATTCARNCSWGHMILETLNPAWLW